MVVAPVSNYPASPWQGRSSVSRGRSVPPAEPNRVPAVQQGYRALASCQTPNRAGSCHLRCAEPAPPNGPPTRRVGGFDGGRAVGTSRVRGYLVRRGRGHLARGRASPENRPDIRALDAPGGVPTAYRGGGGFSPRPPLASRIFLAVLAGWKQTARRPGTGSS
ncbi:hypothetical protein G443_001543 [Actinoalloteichus cyanogriseus DSM 43889]|uniref:Uncharacterized protein n=1 Tax=Actinoalloteichus caeruleus DSM 43889 TaxID=1120930 RepID=A0ABT1JGH3_ACTCY|nr:hypothetical protein [Actinoalloteichus caeruleus DSM 43889]